MLLGIQALGTGSGGRPPDRMVMIQGLLGVGLARGNQGRIGGVREDASHGHRQFGREINRSRRVRFSGYEHGHERLAGRTEMTGHVRQNWRMNAGTRTRDREPAISGGVRGSLSLNSRPSRLFPHIATGTFGPNPSIYVTSTPPRPLR